MILLTEEELSNRRLNENTLKQSKELFETQGFLKIENLFSENFVKKLASGIDAFDIAKSGTRCHKNRYILSLPLKPPFNDPELYSNPIFLELMRQFLGPDCIFSSLGAVVSTPGASDQHVHRDYEFLFKECPALSAALPCYAITVGIPLVEIDLINGPTKIWSGSHRSPTSDKEPFQREFLFGPLGSCYLWDYRTLHAGGSNHSDQIRPLLYMAYTRRWFKDYLNPDQLIIDEEEIQKIPEEHRKLFPLQQD